MIDQISQDVIKIALYLNKKQPGTVSEIWIDQKTKSELEQDLPSDSDIKETIVTTSIDLKQVTDSRRKAYLTAVLDSLEFQINNLDTKMSYDDFSQKAFGFRINRVTEAELQEIEDQLKNSESKLGVSRQEVFKKHSLPKDQYQTEFEKFVGQAKEVLPEFLSDFPDKGFEFETVTGKPWTAFNSHLAPFKSRLTINIDVEFSNLDLYRLAFHEAYGGHHSELSHKDKFLIDQGRGEHGLVITFSPQTFVSEAIAEGVYVLLGGLDKSDDEQMMGWYYDRLIFGLYNLATHLYFDDGFGREEIKNQLQKYGVTEKVREDILNFSLDPVFGKYAPVYYTAFNFLSDLYQKTNNKEELIKTLFTKPCTPEMLIEEFGGK